MKQCSLLLSTILVVGCSDYTISSQGKDILDGDSVPDIVVTPDRIDFVVDPSASGLRLSEVVEISNVGDADLEITGIQLDDLDSPFTVTDLDSARVPPGGSTELVVSSLALKTGEASSTLWIDSTDPEEPTVGVVLTVSAAADDDAGCTCPEGFEAREDGTECFREWTAPATPSGEIYEVCPTIGNGVYGIYGARYPGGSTVQDAFWGDNTGGVNGRLNDIGVWGCTTSGEATSGTSPINTWIGFSVCLEIDAPGDYILGLGADNRMRFRVDGTEVFAQTDDDTSNFNYWWLNTIALTAGSHIIEIEGYNAGSIGAFGAELSGPFPSSSLSDDTAMMAVDYPGRILWNTADAIGSAFPLGDGISWECPDGSTFDKCAEEIECTGEDITECEE